MKRVAIIGGTTFDHIVYLPELPRPQPHTIHEAGFREMTGSTGSGKALALTKLGLPNTLYSVVGEDAFGEKIREYLETEGVDFYFDTDPAGTERHINIMDESGQRISIFVTQSSERVQYNIPVIRQQLERADIIVLNIIAYCRHLIPLVLEQGKPVWTDLHDFDGSSAYHQDFINAARFIHLSSDNLTDYRSTMESLVARGKELVICTHGRAGASLLTSDGQWIEQPALQGLKLEDSNGAGDSFFSGFLYGYLRGWPLQDCMKSGAICGGYAVTSPSLVYEGLSAGFLEGCLNTLG